MITTKNITESMRENYKVLQNDLKDSYNFVKSLNYDSFFDRQMALREWYSATDPENMEFLKQLLSEINENHSIASLSAKIRKGEKIENLFALWT